MAKNTAELKLNKKDLNKYIYAIQCAVDMVDSHEFPLTYNDLTELKNKLTKLNK